MIPVVKDPVGIWAVKWIVVPILILGAAGWMVEGIYLNVQCRKMAKERGFLESSYERPDKYGFDGRCICRSKLNPDGTIDEDARLVLPLKGW